MYMQDKLTDTTDGVNCFHTTYDLNVQDKCHDLPDDLQDDTQNTANTMYII